MLCVSVGVCLSVLYATLGNTYVVLNDERIFYLDALKGMVAVV